MAGGSHPEDLDVEENDSEWEYEYHDTETEVKRIENPAWLWKLTPGRASM